jgi:tetratricopeptide (TPR) repeat protein
MGQMVMVMTPWDNPVCLTRAWCLIELYACRSSGGDFNVALPPSERRRFLNEIAACGSAFYEMLSKVNTAKSECSRDTDKQRIFAAVGRLDGGFVGLDRGVLKTFTEWLEKQLEKEIAAAVGAGHADVECSMIHALGILLRDKGELDRALVMLEKCVAKRIHILGGDHPDTLDALNNMGQFDRALPMYVDCLAKRKRILGDAHPDTLVSLNRLAQLYYNKHDYSRAQALHEECLAKRRLALGEDHQDTIASVNNLAGVFYARGQYSLAAVMFEECVAKNRRVLGDDHPRTFASQTNHANCLSNTGQLERAVSVLQCALATSKRILGDNHLSTITILRSLSHVYRKQGDTKSAAALQAACDTANTKLAGWRLFGEK